MEMEEEVIDLSELLRLLWSHVLQIVAVGLVVVSFLVCTFALTPRYQASVNMIVNTRQDSTTTVSTDNITSAKNMIDTTPVYPQTKKTMLLCALAGMVAACALLVVSHLLHNYIVDDEDVQKKLDLPVLGFIPEV